VPVDSGSDQTGRTGGKCWFVVMFTLYTVHEVLLRLPKEEKGD
jgi:hypothetical protein